jgi:hypothetical protein
MKNIFLIIIFHIFLAKAYSCKCPDYLKDSASVVTAFNENDVVVNGIIKDITIEKGYRVYKILVERKYKGAEVGEIIHIKTVNNNKACGLFLDKGFVYLFYASKDKSQELISSTCSRTRLFSSSLYDPVILDKIK